MRKIIIVLLIALFLIAPSLALTDYQRGVLDGLNRGWSMAQKFDQASAGDPTAYNQAATEFNTWITGIFGQNESLMLRPISAVAQAQPYSVSKTLGPIHEIDSSWNQTLSLTPQPDASGLIHGIPAEMYYSWGPALENF